MHMRAALKYLQRAGLGLVVALPLAACNGDTVTDGFAPFGEALLTGTVLDPAGAPVPLARVSFEVRAGSCSAGELLPAPRSVNTSVLGRFEVSDTQVSRSQFVACVKATAEPPAGASLQGASETVAVLYRPPPSETAEFVIRLRPSS
jgi:hypothetical protein